MKKLFLLLLLSSFAQAEEPSSVEKDILSRIIAPKFAEKDFSIIDFGAKKNEDCSEAIAKAIEACHQAGGGRVVIPDGTWLTGAVHLKSNVNFHLSDAAIVKFIFDTKKYLPVVLTRFEGIECKNFSPLIYAYGQENIAITGNGTLDGGANDSTWWAWNDKDSKPTKQVPDRKLLDQQGTDAVPVAERVYGEGHFLRPNFIQPYRCKNILIENVKIINSPMWEINPVLCSNVTVRGVNIYSHGSNNDGCDPECCEDVLIEKCIFDTGDDCIAIKSGRNNDGRRINVPSQNIIIRDCTMKDGHGGVTMGSEISGGVRNVYVSNCKMDSPHLNQAIRFKSNAVRGGVIENIFIKDIKIGVVNKAVLSIEFDYEEGDKGEFIPTLRNVNLTNVSSEKSDYATYISSIPKSIIENINVSDCTFKGVKNEDKIKNAKAPTYTNVKIERKQ